MENIIHITKSQMQKNKARILKNTQTHEAYQLRKAQEEQAGIIKDKDGGPPTAEDHSARVALELEQKDAAEELKLSQQYEAKALADAHEKANQAEKDHSRAMSLITGNDPLQSDEIE